MPKRLGALVLVLAGALFSQQPPLRVAPEIQEWRLVRHVRPVYPELARKMRISGFVKLAVLISEDGTVEGLRLISGHPLLVPAAMDAVKQWEWAPAYRSGQPMKVFTTVEIGFNMGPSADPRASHGDKSRRAVFRLSHTIREIHLNFL